MRQFAVDRPTSRSSEVMTNPELNELPADDPANILQWLDANRRLLTIAAAVIIVVGGGWWVYNQSRITKETNASKALFLAKQSLNAQNQALAKSDLEKLVARYNGTGSGAEGAMLLAQLDYDQNKYQEGVAVLENAAKSAPQPLESELRGLLGDGYASMKNFKAAASEYEKAADLTDHEIERSNQKARAARAYAAAGDSTKARQLWNDLIDDTKNPSIASEAKVRLGELTAKSEKKG
jgi:predicted negative regulator of RcsB-dependent stress response